MVSCKQCNSLNSLDSAFCKKCGATLDANDIALASEKLVAIIADGNRLFADGRTDDALMVSETALSSNPSSAAAMSLRGMCLERKGLIAEALACFEQVVALEPNSTLDKLKVNDLKNLLVVEKFEVNRRPDRKVAIVGAVAATVLVVTGGALFAKANAKDVPDNSNLVVMNEMDSKARTFAEILPKNDPLPQNPSAPEPQNNPNLTPQGNGQLNGNGPVRPDREREPLQIQRPGADGIPTPRGGNSGEGFGPITIDPTTIPSGGGTLPKVGGGQNQTPTGPTNPPTGQRPIDEPPTNLPDTTLSGEKPKNAPGIIEIEVSNKGGNRTNNGGNGETQINGNGRQALIATARSQMQSGNYSGAANTYERALRAGADQGSTNQRLGQCYANMGRSGDAVAAYTRAASAFEKSGNTQGAEACRQAIKVLGG